MSYVSYTLMGDTIYLQQWGSDSVRIRTGFRHLPDAGDSSLITRPGGLSVDEVVEALSAHGPVCVERGFGQLRALGYKTWRLHVVNPPLRPFGKFSVGLSDDNGVAIFVDQGQHIIVDQEVV